MNALAIGLSLSLMSLSRDGEMEYDLNWEPTLATGLEALERFVGGDTMLS